MVTFEQLADRIAIAFDGRQCNPGSPLYHRRQRLKEIICAILKDALNTTDVYLECDCGNRDTIATPLRALPPCSAGCGRTMFVVVRGDQP
jgi:hypothetical protein